MLLPATTAFLSGLLLGSFLPYLPVMAVLLLLAVAVGITWLEQRTAYAARCGLLLYGVLLCGVAYWTGFERLAGEHDLIGVLDAGPVTIVGTVIEPVRSGPDRSIMVVSVKRIDGVDGTQPSRGRIRISWRHPDQAVRQGDEITATTRVRSPRGVANPGGFDYGVYLGRRHIHAVASVSGPGGLSVARPSFDDLRWRFWNAIDEWRQRIREAARVSLDQPALGMFLGMIIGESDDLTPEVRDQFMATGTVHILSISGSHLGLIALLSFSLTRWVCQRLPAASLLRLSRRITATRLAALLTIPPVVFYTLLAGAQVATVRSLIMIMVFLLAVWLGRLNSVLLALACAAWLILLDDPAALFDISFQLSFVSVLAIGVVLRMTTRDDAESPPVAWLDTGIRWLRSYVWMTMGVTLSTLPLVAYYFNQIPWVGILSNLVIVPMAGFVLVPVGLLSAIWLLLVGTDVLPVAPVNDLIGVWLLKAVDVFAMIPGAEWHVASPGLAPIMTFYLALALLARAGPLDWRKRSGIVIIVLLIGWWAWSPRVWSDEEGVRVTFLDVGQGDASVIELPGGQTVLIDGGPTYDTLDMGRAVLAPYLWDQGIRRIDHIIGTHPQRDHVGGLAWVIRKFEVGHYWGNGVRRDDAFYQRLQSSLQERGLTEEIAQEGVTILNAGACRLDVLNPPAHTSVVPVSGGNSGSRLNNDSVVTRLECGPHSFLFTGDIETGTIARLHHGNPAFHARIIKVPHHGARSSLDAGWVARLHPDVAVISVGHANSYGHPTSAVLSAYAGRGASVLRTDRDGAIQITAKLSAKDVSVSRTRSMALRVVSMGPDMLTQEWTNIRRVWAQWSAASP